MKENKLSENQEFDLGLCLITTQQRISIYHARRQDYLSVEETLFTLSVKMTHIGKYCFIFATVSEGSSLNAF